MFKRKKKEAKETKGIKSTPAKEKKFIADAIINAMPDAIIVLDLNGVILFVNPAHTKILGWKPEERIGKSFDEFGESIKAEDIEKFMILLGELIEKGHVEPIESMARTKDGREIPTSATYSLIKDDEGNPAYIIASLRDISELKHAEEERRKAEAVQERAAIIDAMSDALILLNLDGKIISCNPAYLKMFNSKSIDEILGKGFERFKEMFCDSEKDIPRVLGLFKEVIERGFTEEIIEIRVRRGEDGKEFFVSASSSLLRDAQGNPKNVVVTLRDITERKKTEEETRQKTEDLALINALNDAVNRGDSLPELLQLLARETKRIFSCNGAATYLLSEDREYLVMQIVALSPAIVSRVEKLIGTRIPAINIEDVCYGVRKRKFRTT